MPETFTDCLIHAAAVLADADTLICDGAICLHGEAIAAVGPWKDVRRRHPSLPSYSVGQCLMTPGLVNIHTHLELGYLRGKIPGPASFPDWVCRLFALAPPPEELPQVIVQSVQSGVKECLQCGTTAVGDITRHPAWARTALSRSALRGVSFGEITAMGKARQHLPQRITAAEAPAEMAAGRLTVGLSPHAPYSVEGPALQAIVRHAASAGQPLAMHVAELPYEADFLRNFSGPLGRDWALRRVIDVLDEHIPVFADGPIRWADRWGLFNTASPVILAHVNYVTADDLHLLAGRPNITVVMCPRTRHYFGHDSVAPHPCLQMLASGIRVCIATDSLASSPDLNLLAEATAAHRAFPSLSFTTLFRMITHWPADALNLRAGCLLPGRLADVAVYPLQQIPQSPEDAAAELIVRQPAVQAVMIGSRVVSGKLEA